MMYYSIISADAAQPHDDPCCYREREEHVQWMAEGFSSWFKSAAWCGLIDLHSLVPSSVKLPGEVFG